MATRFEISNAYVWYGSEPYVLSYQYESKIPKTISGIKDINIDEINEAVTRLTGGHVPQDPKLVDVAAIVVEGKELIPRCISYYAKGVKVYWELVS